MLTLRSTITDTASYKLKDLYERTAPGRRRVFMKVLGKAFEIKLRGHFKELNKQPNKSGWPKQNFWARIRNATAFMTATNSTATVTVADPAYAAHFYGATIRPKEAKNIAIPLRPEDAGVRPREIYQSENLFPALRHGKKFLASDDTQRGIIFRYVLKPFVEIPKKTDAAPKDADVLRELELTALKFLRV